MASSNRHWPSMFKSKPCNTDHQQWQHDINPSHISTTCLRNPIYSPVPGYEDRTPEPKSRWYPKPEQIRILEAIFNSGMVNPPRDEIRKIRAQLQQYGQVGDANVFYWFQNRKSRSKHKKHKLSTNITSSSSSSSSDKSSSNENALANVTTTVIDYLDSPTASVNQRQPFLQATKEFLNEPFLQFPGLQQNDVVGSSSADLTQGFCFNEHQNVDNCSTGVLLSEVMLMSYGSCTRVEDEKMKFQQQLSCDVTTAPSIISSSVSDNSPTTYILQGAGLGDPKSTVFINNVYFEVGSGPFDVREAFGDDAVLIQSNGQQVLTNEWGVTLDPLQHGAFYYLIRAFTPSQEDIGLLIWGYFVIGNCKKGSVKNSFEACKNGCWLTEAVREFK